MPEEMRLLTLAETLRVTSKDLIVLLDYLRIKHDEVYAYLEPRDLERLQNTIEDRPSAIPIAFSAWSGSLGFSLLVLSALAVALSVAGSFDELLLATGRLAEITKLRENLIVGYASGLLLALIAFSAEGRGARLLFYCLLTAGLGVPLIIVGGFKATSTIYWIAATAFVLPSIMLAFHEEYVRSRRPRSVWIMSFQAATLCVFGLSLFLKLTTLLGIPSRFPMGLSEGMKLLQTLRLAVGAAALALLTIISFVEAWRQGVPKIRGIQSPSLYPAGRVHSIWNAVAAPFLWAARILFVTIIRVLDVLWKLSAILGTYLGRVGRNLVKFIKDAIVTPFMWKGFAKFSLAASVILSFAALLRTNAGQVISQVSGDSWQVLAVAAAMFVGGVVAAVGVGLLAQGWRLWDEVSVRGALGGAIIALAFYTSGLLLWAVAAALGASWSPGLFTIGMSLPIGVVFLWNVGKWGS